MASHLIHSAITFIALTIANIPNGPSPYGFLFLCEPHILIISILILLNSRQKMSEVRSESSEETRIRTPVRHIIVAILTRPAFVSTAEVQQKHPWGWEHPRDDRDYLEG